MFPEIIIGPALMAVGVMVIICRRGTVELIHRGLTRMYGEPTADMLASGRRAVVGIAGAGASLSAWDWPRSTMRWEGRGSPSHSGSPRA